MNIKLYLAKKATDPIKFGCFVWKPLAVVLNNDNFDMLGDDWLRPDFYVDLN